MRVIVEAIAGPSGARRFVVTTDQSMKIGRTEAADFSFPRDGHMSGIHLQIQVTHDACTVTDLGSTNGTFVNEVRLTAPTVLRGGEQISAGQTILRVKIEADIKASLDFMSPVLFSSGPSLGPPPPP
jgi:predicted component of type VI protein secretion system